MSKINDGGPAFPRQALQVENREQWDYEELRGQSGMSLRAYFAGQALAGMLALRDDRVWCDGCGETVEQWRNRCVRDDATAACMAADALIAKLAEVPE